MCACASKLTMISHERSSKMETVQKQVNKEGRDTAKLFFIGRGAVLCVDKDKELFHLGRAYYPE